MIYYDISVIQSTKPHSWIAWIMDIDWGWAGWRCFSLLFVCLSVPVYSFTTSGALSLCDSCCITMAIRDFINMEYDGCLPSFTNECRGVYVLCLKNVDSIPVWEQLTDGGRYSLCFTIRVPLWVHLAWRLALVPQLASVQTLHMCSSEDSVCNVGPVVTSLNGELGLWQYPWSILKVSVPDACRAAMTDSAAS